MGLSIEDIEQWARQNSYTIVADNWWEAAQDTINKYQQLQADYENRLKADLEAILVELQLEIEEYKRDLSNKDITKDHEDFDHNNLIEVISGNIQQKINALKEK